MVFVCECGEVHHAEKRLLLFLRLAQKDQHVLIRGDVVDPLKTLRAVVQTVERRMAAIQIKERCHVALELNILLMVKGTPVYTCLLRQRHLLADIVPHRQKLLSRMQEHISIAGSEVRKL